MPPYDDDDQRQLEYEREIEREDYERRLDEDERERQRLLDEQERERKREDEERQLEQDEQQRRLDEEQERQHLLDADAAAASQSRTGRKRRGGRAWNWRWARRTREEEHRRVREDDENRWAAERGGRRQRPFIHLVFLGALLVLLGFGAVRILGLYPAISTPSDDPAAPQSADEWPVDTPEWHYAESDTAIEPDPIFDMLDRIEASTAQLTELRQSLSAMVENHQNLDAELGELRSTVDQTRQDQQIGQEEIQGQLVTLTENLHYSLNADSAWQKTVIQKFDELALQVEALTPPSTPPAHQSQTDAEATLPFHLVAIDIWNHVPYANLTQGGAIERAAVGDVVAGWTVTAIDLDRRQVVFQSNGRRLAQTVTR